MNGLIDWLCGFTGDKYVHVMACHLIAFIVARMASLLVGRYAGAVIGAAVAFTVGVLKEYLNDDHVDKDDIKADIIGSVSGALLSII
jgi:hypothetical protein